MILNERNNVSIDRKSLSETTKENLITDYKKDLFTNQELDSSVFNESLQKDQKDQNPDNIGRFSFANEEDLLAKLRSYGNNKASTEYSSPTGAAAVNTIKALQNHNKLINRENEELKQKIMKLQMFYDAEKANFNDRMSNETRKLNELERQIRYENRLLKEENDSLNAQLKDMAAQLNMLKTSSKILEAEKSRHLEQNAIDKEEFTKKLKELKKENSQLKLEVNKLMEILEIRNEEFDFDKTNLKNVQEENFNLKKDFNKKINTCFFELKVMKTSFTLEKNDLLNQISWLKDLVSSLENQKKEIVKHYETKLSYLKNELKNNQERTLKRFMISEREHLKASGAFKKSKSKEKTKSKSKEKFQKKDKVPSSTSIHNMIPEKPNSPDHQEAELKIGENAFNEDFKSQIENQISVSKRNKGPDNLQVQSISGSTKETFQTNPKIKHISELIEQHEKHIEHLQESYDRLVGRLNMDLSLNEYEVISNDINHITDNLNNHREQLKELKKLGI